MYKNQFMSIEMTHYVIHQLFHQFNYYLSIIFMYQHKMDQIIVKLKLINQILLLKILIALIFKFPLNILFCITLDILLKLIQLALLLSNSHLNLFSNKMYKKSKFMSIQLKMNISSSLIPKKFKMDMNYLIKTHWYLMIVNSNSSKLTLTSINYVHMGSW